jgi:hypothetical protein
MLRIYEKEDIKGEVIVLRARKYYNYNSLIAIKKKEGIGYRKLFSKVNKVVELISS